jgi:gamma-glutamyltranspeptidase / glutathione hydrolase
MRARGTLLAVALAVVACAVVACARPAGAPVVAPRASATFPAGWRFTPGERATFAPSAMVASSSRAASEAGLEILKAGGNAVDAAVATGFALAVAWPEAGNIGGGGYMVIRMADGRAAAIDYRETAPAAATRDMYVGADGRLTDERLVGYRANGVPGAVAGMAAALARHGTMPLARVLEPAIRLAREGVVVDSMLARSLASIQSYLAPFEGTELFYPGGRAPRVGDTLRQPALARTLELVATGGPDGFYRGPVADSIVAQMQRGRGLITHDDLARYRPVWREPVRASYRGHALLSMPPSSSGGVIVAEALNMLETWERLPPFGSAAHAWALASVFQRAFVDRNAKMGDPDFVPVPVAELTSKAYARRLRATIRPMEWTPSSELAATDMPGGAHTTHFSVVDAQGNAVATTTTINIWSGGYVRGAGFLLNTTMDDFAAQPGQPNVFGLVQGERNAIAPGKRSLSAMSPTIVMDPAGRVLLVVGAAGGPTIITGTTQLVVDVIDHRMSLADAMRAPRLHHQALPDSVSVEEGGLSPAVLDSLRAMGLAVKIVPRLVTANAIMRVPGGWEGVSEPRSRIGVPGPPSVVGY